MTKWLDVVKSLAPVIIAIVAPGLAPLGTVIASAITEAEQLAGASGPDKKAHVVAIASDAAAAINLTAKKTVVDPATVASSAGSAIDVVVSVANMIHNAATAPKA